MRLDVAKDESAKSKNDVFKIRIQKFQCPENFVKMMRFLTVTVWLFWTLISRKNNFKHSKHKKIVKMLTFIINVDFTTKKCKNSKHKKSWKCRCSLSTIIMFFTSSNSPSALTTVSVFRFVFSSKCGGEYPGNALLVWLLSSFVKGFTSTSGDSSSPLRSTIVLWSKSRSWDDTSLDRWTLSSTERRVMEDLKVVKKQISNIFLASSFEA